jgi:hypothetical protein
MCHVPQDRMQDAMMVVPRCAAIQEHFMDNYLRWVARTLLQPVDPDQPPLAQAGDGKHHDGAAEGNSEEKHTSGSPTSSATQPVRASSLLVGAPTTSTLSGRTPSGSLSGRPTTPRAAGGAVEMFISNPLPAPSYGQLPLAGAARDASAVTGPFQPAQVIASCATTVLQSTGRSPPGAASVGSINPSSRVPGHEQKVGAGANFAPSQVRATPACQGHPGGRVAREAESDSAS